jgi:hypothetical protein
MAVKPITTAFGEAVPPAPGHPAEHTITTYLPGWATIDKFVRGDPATMARMKSVYPRFKPGSQVMAVGFLLSFRNLTYYNNMLIKGN